MKKMNGFYKGYGFNKIWVMEQNIIKHLYLNGPTQIHRCLFTNETFGQKISNHIYA